MPGKARRLLCMTDGSAYNLRRMVLRYERFRSTALGPLLETVQAFITGLPPSQQRTARNALRSHLGRQALDWSAVELAKHKRDEGMLAAGVLTERQRDVLRAAAQGPRERAMIGCLLTLRRAEVCAMRWNHVNLSTGMVLVPFGKGAKSSWTMLTGTTQADLAAWFEAAGSPPDAAPVFPGPRGRPYKPPSLGLIVRKLLIRAGLWTRGLGTAHRFRRTLATEYLRATPGDLVGLQAIMRHENVATTARYAWLTSDDLAPRLARVRL
jgi:integrase